MKDVCLVSMPYEQLHLPSIGIGLLVAGARAKGVDAEAVYPRFRFAEEIGLSRYYAIALNIGRLMLGEWTFAGVAFPGFDPDYESFFRKYMQQHPREARFCKPLLGEDGDLFEAARAVREAAGPFVRHTAEAILQKRPRIVGCSSTFQQHCACLSLLREIKELDPDVITMIGGANCRGDMGLATQRAFPWIDVTVSGEADELFPGLCLSLLKDGTEGALKSLPQGAYARDNGAVLPSSPTYAPPVMDLDALPYPDYEGYFEAVASFAGRDRIKPRLHMETSRGCWWGKCRFCGMLGKHRSYRAKTADRVLAEMEELSTRHSVSLFCMTDNILNNEYFTTVLPKLGKSECSPYLISYEVKSDLKEDHIKLLAEAGVRIIQPGIESFHDEVLRLMRKGTVGITSIALLKFAREKGIYVLWKMLYGVPGDQDGWYREMADTLPMVAHLQPPDALMPILYARFSEYHEENRRYGLELAPADVFSYIYPVPDSDLGDLAFFFVDRAGEDGDTIREPGVRALQDRITEWQGLHKQSGRNEVLLTVEDLPGGSLIRDSRPCAVTEEFLLTGLLQRVYRACTHPRTRSELHGELDGIGEEDLEAALQDLARQKVLLRMGDRYLSLALRKPVAPLLSYSEFPAGCDLELPVLSPRMLKVLQTLSRTVDLDSPA